MTTQSTIIDVSRTQHNNAIYHAMSALKSERARADGSLTSAIDHILGGNCVYLPHFLCSSDDFTVLASLKSELMEYSRSTQKTTATENNSVDSSEGGEASPSETTTESVPNDGMVAWSKHLKHENPTFSVTFQRVIATISEYFDVDVFASRLNYYADGTHWKPFHKDSHAYAGPKRDVKEDFTIGVSLGATRDLTFLHEESDSKFSFPQRNGDVFAFSSDVNDRFMHGVPKATNAGERFSVIAWGKRRTLNARNSSAVDVTTQQGGGNAMFVDRIARAMHGPAAMPDHVPPPIRTPGPTPTSAPAPGGKKQRNRLQ